MGLRDEIQIAILEAMQDEDGFYDLVENFNFVIYSDQSGFDVEEDTYNPVPTRSSCRGMFVQKDESYSKRESDVDFQTLMINPVDLEDGFVPSTDAKIELSDGQIFRIIEVKKVPGGSSPVVIYKINVAKDDR